MAALYGTVPPVPWPARETPEVKPHRLRRFNCVPPVVCCLLPWGLFVWLFWVRSFKVHYATPGLANLYTAAGLVFVLCLFLIVVDRFYRRRAAQNSVQPSWVVFFFLTCAPAAILGAALGEYNYQVNMRPFYDVADLNSYLDVDPVMARGQQFMDAGRIEFTEESRLDIERSMGFSKDQVYCVAPVTTTKLDGNSTGLAIYDFWAIGKNCCQGSTGGDFRCGLYSSKHAHGGLRLLDDAERPYYRLAVQQAEAAFNMKAVHPIFLYWMSNPIEEVDAYETAGWRLFTAGVMYSFVAQLFCVLLALILISKLATY